MKNLSVGYRMLAGFLFVALLCVVVGATGWFALGKMEQNILEVGEVRLPSVSSLLELSNAAANIRVAQRTLLNQALSNEERERQFASIAAEEANAKRAWDKFAALPQSGEEEVLWNAFVPLYEDYLKENAHYLRLIRELSNYGVINPQGVIASLQQFRGDHLIVMERLDTALRTGTDFPGGDNPTQCNFGRWLASFRTSNSTLAALIASASQDHNRFHEYAGQIKELANQGEVARGHQLLRGEMQQAVNGVFATFAKMLDVVEEVNMLYQEMEFRVLVRQAERQQEMLTALQKIIELNESIAADSVRYSMDDVQQASVTIIMVALVALVLAIVLGIFLTRNITRPILQGVAFAQRVADGDLSQKLDLDQKDEMGRLVGALNAMVESLRHTVSDIQLSADGVASASEELGSSASQMSAGMDQQAERVALIASASLEMAQTSTEIARNMHTIQDNAASALEQSRKGGDVVQQSAIEMVAIAEQVVKASSSAGELKQKADKVQQVIEVINGIADQTNLLALNAAIEAARAGEAGRGFAVVADEVRKLAERSGSSAHEISEIIKSIQEGVTHVVRAMELVTSKAQTGEALSKETDKAFMIILAGMEGLQDLITQNAAGVEEMSATADQITEDIQTISSTAEETASVANEVAHAAEGLAQLATSVQQSVSGFRLENARPLLSPRQS
ncbi:methyl-accepting chemotaxis protein [Chrysiogenes arsenatis]|uniref:methyl-accepting chemotaxis protein n=1 Tax=Chrysiogenes arsenatis TaxID=309797 RepID=UPI0004203353|nr:methyl-accepting chemotaxis protein [Chrysiogenes arsenatis]